MKMPRFQIIVGNPDAPKETWRQFNYWPPAGNEPITEWDSPQEPNALVKDYNANSKKYKLGVAYMLARLPDAVDFQARENAREDYTPFEIQGQSYHCAELKGTEISYYPTRNDAYDDKRHSMKVGRYLRRYTDKRDTEISAICARYGLETEDAVLKFAKTREEIKHVYMNGPRSCMKGDPEDFNGAGVHPAEAYAAGDMEIAYLQRDDRITARTVVIPSKKIWIGIYGDYERLTPLLQDAGYKAYNYDEDHYPMLGLKFLKIDIGNRRWAMPYLDADGYVNNHENPEFLTVDKHNGARTSEYGYITHDFESAEDDYDEEDWDY
jgi:hypothetical protein